MISTHVLYLHHVTLLRAAGAGVLLLHVIDGGPALPAPPSWDYANVYNYHCALLSPENISHIMIIVGGVAGVVVLIVGVICCYVCWKKKCNKKSGKTAQGCLHLNFSVMIRRWK